MGGACMRQRESSKASKHNEQCALLQCITPHTAESQPPHAAAQLHRRLSVGSLSIFIYGIMLFPACDSVWHVCVTQGAANVRHGISYLL
jgi:hypothetical protein